MPEGASRDVAFRAKELDATVVGSAQYPAYKADPQISKNMVEVAELFTRLIGFNPNYEPFKKKEVRQAINHAIDAKLIIERLLKGHGLSGGGLSPQHLATSIIM
jgi:peptide/nickel transport system substrate-binding protein